MNFCRATLLYTPDIYKRASTSATKYILINKMINKLVKQFNSPLSKYRNNFVKGTTFSKTNNFTLVENHITYVLTSFFKRLYIIINKPIFEKTSDGIKVYILYYLPNIILLGNKNSLALRAIQRTRRNNMPLLRNSKSLSYNLIKKIRMLYADRTLSARAANNIPQKNYTNILCSLSSQSETLELDVNKNFRHKLIDKFINKNRDNFAENKSTLGNISLKKIIAMNYLDRLNTLIQSPELSNISNTEHLISNHHLSGDTELSRKLQLRSKMKFISMVLSKILNTNVTIETTRIKYPQFDSHILSQYLGMKSFSWSYSKMKKFIKIIPTKSPQSIKKEEDTVNSVYNSNSQSLLQKTVSSYGETLLLLPTALMGINLRVAGRLHKQRVVPKKTLKTTNKGPSAPNTTLAIQNATFVGKNRKGSYSIRVLTSHKLRNKSVAPLGPRFKV